MIEIRTIKGWWFSLGIHIDLKHRHIDIHFIWWIIVLGNTKETIRCGECGEELSDGATECPNCGAVFEGTTLLDSILDIVESQRMKVLRDPNDPSWTEHFAELKNEIISMWNEMESE